MGGSEAKSGFIVMKAEKFLNSLFYAAFLAFLLAGRAFCAEGGRIPLAIRSGGSSHAFQVEVAREEEERRRGLMFREKLGEREGMLFIFESAGWLTFWMKNTPLSLDILFIDENKKIVNIHAGTKPFQEFPTYESKAPCRYVLEVVTGTCRRLGIRPGDRVEFQSLPAKGK